MEQNARLSAPNVDISQLLDRRSAITYLAAVYSEAPVSRRSLTAVTPDKLSSLISERRELEKVDPRFFEELIADLLRADGFDDVQLVPRMNAPGPDIIAMCTSPLGHRQQLLVEVKRWTRAVGIEVVRETMYKVDTEFRATSALIVTSSEVTQAAIEELNRFHVWRLAIMDGTAVQAWLQRHAQWLTDQRASSESLRTAAQLLNLLQGADSRVTMYLRACAGGCRLCGGQELCAQAIYDYSRDVYDTAFQICLSCHNAHMWEASPLLRYGKPGECEICGVIRQHGCSFNVWEPL